MSLIYLTFLHFVFLPQEFDLDLMMQMSLYPFWLEAMQSKPLSSLKCGGAALH